MLSRLALLAGLAITACAAPGPASKGERAAEVAVRTDVVPALTFSPPFETFDSEGARTAGDFMHGGAADIKKNYARLTPDRGVSAGLAAPGKLACAPPTRGRGLRANGIAWACRAAQQLRGASLRT